MLEIADYWRSKILTIQNLDFRTRGGKKGKPGARTCARGLGRLQVESYRGIGGWNLSGSFRARTLKVRNFDVISWIPNLGPYRQDLSSGSWSMGKVECSDGSIAPWEN